MVAAEPLCLEVCGEGSGYDLVQEMVNFDAGLVEGEWGSECDSLETLEA